MSVHTFHCVMMYYYWLGLCQAFAVTRYAATFPLLRFYSPAIGSRWPWWVFNCHLNTQRVFHRQVRVQQCSCNSGSKFKSRQLRNLLRVGSCWLFYCNSIYWVSVFEYPCNRFLGHVITNNNLCMGWSNGTQIYTRIGFTCWLCRPEWPCDRSSGVVWCTSVWEHS